MMSFYVKFEQTGAIMGTVNNNGAKVTLKIRCGSMMFSLLSMPTTSRISEDLATQCL